LKIEKTLLFFFGVDGKGDVYNPLNLEFVEKEIGSGCNIVIADGGFKIRKNDQGEHMENYQELFSGRIIMSEFLLMMKTLEAGGNFVCKLFDSF